jgi:hypothetical protein
MNNGYTTIEINGEAIGLKFGMPAIEYLAEKGKKVKLYKLNDKGVPEFYTHLGMAHTLYAGYVNNCQRKDADVVLEFETFYDFVDESTGNKERLDAIRNAMQVFEDSRIIAQTKDKEEGTKKKDGHGKKSNPSATVS